MESEIWVYLHDKSPLSHLEERHSEFLGPLLELCPEDAVAQVGLPLQFAPGVLAVVKLLEDFLQSS